MKSKGFCIVCKDEIEGDICCNSYECPCQGKIEFPFCSEECYDKYMKKDKTNESSDKKETPGSTTVL